MKGRGVMKKLFVLMLMTTILYTGYNFLQDDTVYHYEQITVHTGDTMWAIADRWADQDEDVREVIYRICETNALANTNLKPGQKLLVPVRMQFVDQLMVAEAGDIKGLSNRHLQQQKPNCYPPCNGGVQGWPTQVRNRSPYKH